MTHTCIFNHSSFFLAWVNGKSARRMWLEEQGFAVQNRNVRRNDFERYFKTFSNDEQGHCTQNNWI